MGMQSKQGVALSSVFASLLLTGTKGVVGVLTGSLAILSEAAHSALDMLAALLTYFAVRVSDKPADEAHHFGHAKIESVSALIETGLLFLTSAWIIWEAVARLVGDAHRVEASWYAVGVIVLSIVVDFSRARALKRVAEATKSQALEADALHFSSDIISSAAVLIGLGFVALGYPMADAIAALVVACFVILAGYRLGRRTFDVLIDTAPEGALERVRNITLNVPGVVRLGRARVRPAGGVLFVDIVVQVSRLLPLDQAQTICREIADRIRAELPEAEVLAHAEPLALDGETIMDAVKLTAARLGLAVHHVAVRTTDGKKRVSLDLEVEEDLAIGDAHEAATRLEEAIQAELGQDVLIDTHIEPRSDRVVKGSPISDKVGGQVAKLVRDVAGGVELISDVRDIMAEQGPDGLYLTLHCLFDRQVPLKRVHAATDRLETLLRTKELEFDRIVIHAEPSQA